MKTIWIMMPLYLLASLTIIIGGQIYGDIVKDYSIIIFMGVVSLFVSLNSETIVESKRGRASRIDNDFMKEIEKSIPQIDMIDIPDIKEEPIPEVEEEPIEQEYFKELQQPSDEKERIKQQVILNLQTENNLNKVVTNVSQMGFNTQAIVEIIQSMIKEGEIRLDSPETTPQQSPLPVNEPQVEKVEQVEKKPSKVKCPKCGKSFESEKNVRKHYGMAHYTEIELK